MLLFDNLNIILPSHNPTLHAHTKDIELTIHFVYEHVISKYMKIQHVHFANTLTKSLGTTALQEFCTKLKAIVLTPHNLVEEY